jgi:hypothetical protein
MHHGKSVTAFLVVVVAGLLLFDKCQSTPLDDYVHAPDPHMNWTVLQTYELPDYFLYILNFTSQKWLDGKYRAIHILSLVYVVHRNVLGSTYMVALLMHQRSKEVYTTKKCVFVD